VESVRDQLSTLIHMIVGGLITGLLFDLYRLVRGVIRPHRFITDLGDLLFWAVATIVMFIMLVNDNWGQVRVYVFLGWAIGLLFYRAILSSSFIYLVLGVAKLFGRIADGLSRARVSASRLMARPFRRANRRVRAARRQIHRRSRRREATRARPATAIKPRSRAVFLSSRFAAFLRRTIHRWKKTK
jgi:spore cortex biosynthesis protein YabQ